jgi:hypothetical protein
MWRCPIGKVQEVLVPVQPQGVRTAVTLVHAEACHFCDDAVEELARLAECFALDVEVVELDSIEGRRLVDIHRPAMNPLVLVDGAFFSSGRLPRKKLTRLLEARAAAVAVPARAAAVAVPARAAAAGTAATFGAVTDPSLVGR